MDPRFSSRSIATLWALMTTTVLLNTLISKIGPGKPEPEGENGRGNVPYNLLQSVYLR